MKAGYSGLGVCVTENGMRRGKQIVDRAERAAELFFRRWIRSSDHGDAARRDCCAVLRARRGGEGGGGQRERPVQVNARASRHSAFRTHPGLKVELRNEPLDILRRFDVHHAAACLARARARALIGVRGPRG